MAALFKRLQQFVVMSIFLFFNSIRSDQYIITDVLLVKKKKFIEEKFCFIVLQVTDEVGKMKCNEEAEQVTTYC